MARQRIKFAVMAIARPLAGDAHSDKAAGVGGAGAGRSGGPPPIGPAAAAARVRRA